MYKHIAFRTRSACFVHLGVVSGILEHKGGETDWTVEGVKVGEQTGCETGSEPVCRRKAER